MKHCRHLVLASLSLAVTCLAQDVRYNFDQGTDFSKFKSYKLAEAKGVQIDDLMRGQLVDAIKQELAKKGLSNTSGDDADPVVAYQVAVTTEKQFDTWNDGWGMGPGWRGGWAGETRQEYSQSS